MDSATCRVFIIEPKVVSKVVREGRFLHTRKCEAAIEHAKQKRKTK